MMRFDPANFRHEFVRCADIDRVQRDRLERLLEKERHKQEAEDEEQEFLTIAQAVVQATMEEIAAFESRLEEYEALTVEEIQFLRDRIDALTEERERLLEVAHVLPDGRRIFKTENGERVFDEFGAEVLPEIISPEAIDDSRPRWETFKSATEALERANHQLDEALQFQSELDDIREQLERDGLTKDELDDLESRLEQTVPASFRARQLTNEGLTPTVVPSADFATAASEAINLDTLTIDAPGLGD